MPVLPRSVTGFYVQSAGFLKVTMANGLMMCCFGPHPYYLSLVFNVCDVGQEDLFLNEGSELAEVSHGSYFFYFSLNTNVIFVFIY